MQVYNILFIVLAIEEKKALIHAIGKVVAV